MKDGERVAGLPVPALFLLRSPVIPEALRWKPDHAEAHNNLGIAFYHQRRTDEAIRQFQEALRLKPDYADARNYLDNVLATRAQASPPPADPNQTRAAAREGKGDRMFDRWWQEIFFNYLRAAYAPDAR